MTCNVDNVQQRFYSYQRICISCGKEDMLGVDGRNGWMSLWPHQPTAAAAYPLLQGMGLLLLL